MLAGCAPPPSTPPPIEYLAGSPWKTFDDDDAKIARAWNVVKVHYPKTSQLVREIKLAHIHNIFCDCWGAVWPHKPSIIYLDVGQTQTMTDVELQAMIVHEMIHVKQFHSGHKIYVETLDKDAYAEQTRYKTLVMYSPEILLFE